MQRAAVVLAVASMAVAGCLTGAQDTAPQGLAVGDPMDLPVALPRLGMQGCEDHVGITLIPIATDPIKVPEGFRPLAVDPAGLLDAHFMIGYACASAEGAAQAEGAAGLFPVIGVDPPDAYEEEGIGFYGIPILAHWLSSEDLAAVFAGWGFSSIEPTLDATMGPMRGPEVGTISLEVLGDAPAGRAGHVLGSAGGRSIHMYTLAQGQVGNDPGGKGRLFAFLDGKLSGAIDLAWTESNLLSEGKVAWRFDGFAPPPPPVLGGEFVIHSWGEGYAYEWTYTPLAEGATENLRSPPSPRLHGVDLGSLARGLPALAP